MSGTRSYYAIVWRRTRSRLTDHVRAQVAVSLVIAVIAGLLAWWADAGPSSLAYALGGSGIWILGAGTFYAMRAPSELHAETQGLLAAATTARTIPWADFTALVEQHITSGEELVARLNSAGSPAEVAAIEPDLDEWERATQGDLLAASPARAVHFGEDDLVTHLSSASPTQINDANYWLQFLLAKVHRLKTMIGVMEETDDAAAAVMTNQPVAAVAEVTADDIRLRLVHSRHFSSASIAISEAHCIVYLQSSASISTEFGPVELAPDESLEVRYPHDFKNPQWPLEPGVHEGAWSILWPDGSRLTTGCRIRVNA